MSLRGKKLFPFSFLEFLRFKKRVIVDIDKLNTKERVKIKKDFNETIFVRIDKFNSARRDVEEIGRDLKQIENVLEKITSIKIKEDEEIEELNKNIDEVKNIYYEGVGLIKLIHF
jgi:hypothetical protein